MSANRWTPLERLTLPVAATLGAICLFAFGRDLRGGGRAGFVLVPTLGFAGWAVRLNSSSLQKTSPPAP